MTASIAAVAREPHGPFSVETIEVGEPRAGEVRVRIAGVGLCHTDLIFRDQLAPFALPGVLGHEGAGVIEAVGEGVKGLAIGDAVVVGFSSCGTCPRCAEHLPSYCQNFVPLNYAGMRLDDGSTAYAQDGARITSHFFGQSSFSALTLTRATNVVKVDTSHVALELLGPLGCGFQTGAGGVMRSLACPAGSSIAIFGGGPVGLAAVMGAVIQGCSTIILVEPIAARRDVALELGATHVIDPKATEDVLAKVKELSGGGVNHALDTTGIPAVVAVAAETTIAHGTVGLIAVPPPEAMLPASMMSMLLRGTIIKFITEGDADPQTFIPQMIDWYRAGKFPFDRLVKTFPFDEINEAAAASEDGSAIKPVLVF